LFVSCDNSKTIKNPQDYNQILAPVVISVQNPLDSLENYLLTVKFRLDEDSTLIFKTDNNLDTLLMNKLIEKTYSKINEGKNTLSEYEFYETDNLFKPQIIKSFDIIKSSLDSDFTPLIEILIKSDNKKSKEILNQIIPFGKNGFINYERAIDSIIVGQSKFLKKYKLENEYIIRFNF